MLEEQGPDIGYISELCLDYKKHFDEVRWAGISKRSTQNAIYLKSGLRSGQRDTDMVNTMLNRVQFQTVT